MARPLRIEYPGAFYHVINRWYYGRVYSGNFWFCQLGKGYLFKITRDNKRDPQLTTVKSFTAVEKVVETVSREFECDAELIMRKRNKWIKQNASTGGWWGSARKYWI